MKLLRKYTPPILAFLISSTAIAETVALQVICDDAAATKRIQSALETKIKKEGLVLSDKLPDAKLFLYAQQNTGSTINKNGWSFAIAHVSNRRTYYVAAKLFKSEAKEVKEVEPVLINMLQQEGFMTYLNVVQSDDLSEKSLATIADDAAKELSKRIKP